MVAFNYLMDEGVVTRDSALNAYRVDLRRMPEAVRALSERILTQQGRGDYEGVGAWMTGRWRTKDPLVADIVAACKTLAASRRLTLTFLHQRGHQSSWAGRDDFAHFNARADALASEAATGG